ncbi:MAG: hypothetical protein IT436_18555 [Phycisphaerales bacterium]|nr:hypothetical protein [Phycisphaerales bacterium]
MKRIEVIVELDAMQSDLPTVSRLVGTPCDPSRSVQQGQIDPVRKVQWRESVWRLGIEVDGQAMESGVRELVGKLKNWPDIPPEVRASFDGTIKIHVFHNLAMSSVLLSANLLRYISDNQFDLAVTMMETSED